MSALPSKADMCGATRDVRFVPKADIPTFTRSPRRRSAGKAGDLPVQEPTKFPLLINAKSAKIIGVVFPPALLVAADEVID